ncbi:hypothetical protein [Streptomyces sp. NPDC050564]|uniref:hypothetical protein n=1 Tax=Streptomyces sp. NPDC050564 TaxID=3365631 RepID=UPI0037A1CAD7
MSVPRGGRRALSSAFHQVTGTVIVWAWMRWARQRQGRSTLGTSASQEPFDQ